MKTMQLVKYARLLIIASLMIGCAVVGCAVVGCAVVGGDQLTKRFGKSEPRDRMVSSDSKAGQHFLQEVKPILEGRCASCHACYDAPCQLKMTSAQGIDRGASKALVYKGSRLTAAKTTRLFIDAQTTQEWREKQFFPVLNERDQNPDANKALGVLHRSLMLKQHNPLPGQAILSGDNFDLSLNRANICPKPEEYDRFAINQPMAGMPFGLPGLSQAEHRILTEWVESGARMATLPPLPNPYREQVADWERFLNQSSDKSRLISRYIYEHLFLGHLYFDDLPLGIYFSLVRSATPPGEPIEVIATRLPYGDPGVERVYSRLQRVASTLVGKTHMPYKLNRERMALLAITRMLFGLCKRMS